MPTLQSLSIRRRGTTPAKSSAPPTTTTHTFKGLFHRKTIDSATHKFSQDKSKDKMGNAPSDMNGNGPNGPAKQKLQLGRGSTSDRDSVRSRAMPGAEPPTPTPAPDPFVEKTEDQRSPEPGTVQVQGYDTQDVPHVLHESPKAAVEPDLEAGVVPPVGSFEVEEPQQQQPQIQSQQEAENQNQTATVTEGGAAADALRTPRAELKTEESLTPLDLGVLPAHHAEGSDATAVDVNVDVAVSPRTSSPNVWTPGTYVLLNARSGTALDLSGADHRSVIGWPMHGGPNQQWEFIPTGHGYIVRCIRRSKEGHSLYLSTEGGVKDGARIIASTYPVAWNIEPTEDGIRCVRVLLCIGYWVNCLSTGYRGRTLSMCSISPTGVTLLLAPRCVHAPVLNVTWSQADTSSFSSDPARGVPVQGSLPAVALHALRPRRGREGAERRGAQRAGGVAARDDGHDYDLGRTRLCFDDAHDDHDGDHDCHGGHEDPEVAPPAGRCSVAAAAEEHCV